MDLPADVIVRLGAVDLGEIDPTASRQDLAVSADGTRCRLENVATYHIREGREIIIDPFPGADMGLIRFNLMGLGFGLLMHQRGLLVLHASVVAIGEGAVAFLGFSGAGKSTTAAALIGHGHAIVADDVAAIDVNAKGGPIVLPAFPELRLWPESARSLGWAASGMSEIHQGSEKRSGRSSERFQTRPTPLRQIYILDEGPKHAIKPLRPAAACMEMMRHSLVAGILKPTGTTASHFHNCVQLARSVPAARFVRRKSLAAVNELAALVEEHLVQAE
ncbi:MAG: serine kinase [Planctomycetota bacterium]|nr:serine kinase [Planctomycetota bacterium]